MKKYTILFAVIMLVVVGAQIATATMPGGPSMDYFERAMARQRNYEMVTLAVVILLELFLCRATLRSSATRREKVVVIICSLAVILLALVLKYTHFGMFYNEPMTAIPV